MPISDKNNKKSVTDKKKVHVDVVIKDSKFSILSDSKFLNKLGLAVVGVSTIGTLLVDTNSSKKKKEAPKSSVDLSFVMNRKLSPPSALDTKPRSILNEKLKRAAGGSMGLPTMEEMFKDRDVDDFLQLNESSVMKSDKKKEEKAIVTSTPASVPVPALHSPPPPVKKGFFERIFKKAGGDRPTDLITALKPLDDLTHTFRESIVQCLVNYIPQGYIKDWEGYYISISEEQALATIERNKEEFSLSPQIAADSFADVANAMLVALVDQAASTLDMKDDNKTIAALNIVGDFVYGAGSLFTKSLSSVSIDPVQYNGRVKGSKLESLYYTYAKASMSLPAMLSASGLTGSENSDSNQDDGADKLERLGQLQQVFGIKEGKRNNIDQKVLKEMMMSGDGGLNDLGGIFESLKSGSNGKEMEDLLGGFGGNIPGADEELTKELKNMKPEEIEQMSKEALSAVKQGLEAGQVTKKDVEELEKIMGINVKQLAKMMEGGQVDKRKMAELGPDFNEMLDIFKKLATIK